MTESSKSSCHFLLEMQLLYRILENVTDVYNGTHLDGATQNKKLSNWNIKYSIYNLSMLRFDHQKEDENEFTFWPYQIYLFT